LAPTPTTVNLRYVFARFGLRNVWWSMANHFDFLKAKTDADWDRFLKVVTRPTLTGIVLDPQRTRCSPHRPAAVARQHS